MARISTYNLDGTISNTDKVIGTDSSSTTTKNFRIQDIKEFTFSSISGPVTINSLGVSSVTFPAITLGTDTSGDYVKSLVAGGGIQLLNNSGETATPTVKVNPLQTTITSILNNSLCIGRDSTDKICFTTDNQIRFTVNNALDLILKENALTPGTSDGTALGADDAMWSDLFLASLSVINFNDGNVTVTHGDGVLQIDTDSKLEFGDTGTFIHQSASGILDLVSDDELELNATNEVEINTTLVDVNASGAITLNAEANSNITITGELDIDSSSALTIDSATSISIGNHQDKPVDIDASTLQIDASGGFSIDSGAVSSNMTVATGGGNSKDLTISVTGGGDSSLVLTSTGTGTDALDINSSGGIDIDSTGGVTVDAGGNSNITVTGSLDVDASSNITIDGTGVSIDGTLDSNFTVDGNGQDLALKAIGGGAQVLSLDSAGTGTNAIDINATGGGVDIVAAANVSMLAATSFVAQGNTSAKFGDDTEQIEYDGSGNLDIDAVAIDLDSSGAINILADGDASDIIIKTNHVAGPAFHLDANSNVGSIVDIDAGILYIASDGLTSMLSASTFDIDAVGAVTIDGSAITIGADDSGVAISIGHTTSETTVNDNLTVTGTLKANGLTYPANVNDANINEVLTKTSNGTIGFSTPASVGVSANTDDSDRTVVFANGNVLHDDNDTVSSSSFKYNPNDKILTVNNIVPKTNAAGDIGTSTVAYNDLFLSNAGVIKFIAGTGEASSITHIDSGSDGVQGSLRISSSTKLEFNDNEVYIASLADGHLDLVSDTEVQIVSPIVNIDASTRVDVSNLLQVGGNLTFTNDGNHDIVINSTAAGTPGKYLAISAGSAAASGSNNTNGGDLFLQSGNGDGNGTSDIIFKTKTATGGNSVIERMRIKNAGVDINTAADISGNLVLGANLSVPGSLNLDSVANANLGVTINNVQISSNTFSDSDNTLMTAAAIDDRIISSQSMGSGFILEDADGTELAITENKEVKFIGSGGLTINWTDTDNGTDGDPYDLTFTIGTLDQNTTGSAATLTSSRNIAATGDIAWDVNFNGATNSTAAAVIQNNKVTHVKYQDVATNTIIGRTAANSGDVKALSKTEVLEILNVEDGAQVNAVTSIVAGAGIDVNAATGAVTVTAETAATNNPGVVELATTAETTTGTDTTRAITANGLKDATHVFNELITAPSFTSKGNTNSRGGVINLSTTDTTITANDILGTIEFQAPDESTGNDSRLVAAEIRAVSEEIFNNNQNDTKFEFITSRGTSITSGTAPVVTISSGGNLTAIGSVTASGKIQGAEIEGTSLDINGNASISGILDITNTTDSSNDSGDTGALRCEGGASINGKIYADGNVTAPNFVVASDRRLKSEIEPIKEGLEVIKQFTSYNYIKRGEKESGFIAQEVQKVLPHTVYENSDGMLSMSDRGVVAHMHKAILELEKRLISIEEKLK